MTPRKPTPAEIEAWRYFYARGPFDMPDDAPEYAVWAADTWLEIADRIRAERSAVCVHNED